jgi:HEPN domain-containing protein
MTGTRSPDNPKEWLSRAKSSLALARAVTPEIFYEDGCFQAQQAAEKAIKAVFVRQGMRHPYTHDINALLSVIADARITIPEPVWAAVALTTYASAARYPGSGSPVTKEEYREALTLADAVIQWTESLM